jgi:Concanavalin A-like lectin/glucanases superfamily
VTHPESYSLQFNGPQLEFTIIQAGVRKRLKAPAGAIQPGSTYHVVGTFDGATQRLYVNGVEVANAPLAGGASKSSTGIYVGSWDSGQEYFNGVIDDVAVYNVDLDFATIQQHFTLATTGGTSG